MAEQDEPQAEDQDDSPDGRRKVPAEAYDRVQPAPLPAMAPDGGPALGVVGQPAKLPDATPAIYVCLRGPCRYYWQMVTHLASGNPALTWDAEDGIRTPMVCPTCQGARQSAIRPLVAQDQGVEPCGYKPSQGIWAQQACRLLPGHLGAHHHGPSAPEPRPAVCPSCDGAGVVPDPDGQPVQEPKQISRSCLRQPGVDTDLTEDIVYACSAWDPTTPNEHKALEDRRRVYLKLHPEHAPKKG